MTFRATALRTFLFLLSLTLLSLLLISSSQAGSLFEKGTSRFNSWFSDSSQQSEFLRPEQAFKPEAWIEGSQLFVRWDIEPGYYLYHKQLEILLDNEQGLQLTDLLFSPTITNEDEFFGITEVYYDQALIAGTLSGEAAGETLNLTLRYQGCADAGLCYPPERAQVQVKLSDLDTSAPAQALEAPSSGSSQAAPPTTSSGQLTQVLSSGQTWLILGLFFVAGLGLTFTPCVLPMLPILSAIILGKGDNPQVGSRMRGFLLSSAYVLGMAVTYALLGALMGLFGAGLNLQAALQSPWLLIPFAILFVGLALAMFGVWEFRMPLWLENRLQALQQPKGGTLVGVAGMGALSTLVVSPCMTAPLAGALVFIAATEDALTGAWALFAMALGMGLPLMIAATFGAKWLPRAGVWMNQVKAFFGLLLLVVAVWLIERLLPAATVLAVWGLLALGTGIFIGGLNFRVAGNWQKLRLTLGLALIIYGGSLLIGALAGNTNPLQPLANLGQTEAYQELEAPPKITELKELQELIENAEQPVMVDLYADWCISCKVMESRIFPRSEIQQELQGVTRIKFDLTRISDTTREWMDAKQLFGPPSFLFYTNGQEWRDWRIQGEVNARELQAHLQAFNQARR
ncbi:thiol:disulfide interchange protein DsbD [Marinospirillum celere]|uniref:Thiol:disulfide interchange protein DsbD n=1 Tax=Marinospirillum celere TaxID=1122252 RepID=A0A1I1E8Q5_9GAMM|nr:protein-disulfide reductase DsbD [Marinospirillum celere]SFB81333.1 thiol:disulfide interchange protein DsbD [Marinospirillum celere]